MQQHDSRNTFLFIACAIVLLFGYEIFVLQPMQRKQQAARAAAVAAQQPASTSASAANPASLPPAIEVARPQALAASPRTVIDTPALSGSLALRGARIDDLYLKKYRETLQPNSPPVELFRPDRAPHAFFAEFGWTAANLQGLPGRDTVWTAPAGARLTPQTPVVLTYRSPQGLQFTRTIAVDQNYMFTITDTAANFGATPVTIAPYASVQRHGMPEISRTANAFQGAIGWLGGSRKPLGYKDWKKHGGQGYTSTGGWLGITDKYWLAAVIPDQRQPVRATYRVTPSPVGDLYDASFVGGGFNIAPGKQATVTTRLFAGAKTVPLLKSYEASLGVPGLVRAIDWGMLFFLTQPIFWVLEQFYHLLGNFGLAILLLTVCVRAAFFWPSNKSYESMTKMKKVQPELEQIRKRYKEDPAKQQQEMMALYGREKINPVMGCLPVLATIPVFLALYKVLSVTIEMRHAPFFGWVRDLSAPDPTNIWNLFGLIPWDPSSAPLIGSLIGGVGLLHLGVWAIAYGVTMWLTQSMSPTTGMDPMQAKMMKFFPLVFTFVLGQFAVGLLIYYTWSNILGIVQQYVIMRRFKVDNPIDQIVRRLTGKAEPAKA